MSLGPRRVVVTGIGVLSPLGLDVPTTWQALLRGESGIRNISAFDASAHASQIAGECRGFQPERFVPQRDVRSMDRFIHLTVAASDEAMRDAGLEPEALVAANTGTILGVGMGGLGTIEATAEVLHTRGPSRVTPYFVPASIPNLAPGQVSMRHRLTGPSFAISSACASSSHAIGEASRAIACGDMDVCVTGGAESVVTPLGVAGFCAMRALSRNNAQAERASRPWDASRDGFVISEGAALLVLEERSHALARAARIYAEVTGYAASADAHHLTQPAPGGEGAVRAMERALRAAQLRPEDVDYVNAHATSTPVGDVLELQALRTVFGAHAERGLWVSSTKGATGHLLGAAGALEAAFCALALRDSRVPPTLHLESPIPEAQGFDLVPHESRSRSLRHVVSNSFGFGGTNVSLVLSAHAS
jgi:3-oxoacyl-[acyl-carrier-protein] synthase II